jgi:hypothetical protein
MIVDRIIFFALLPSATMAFAFAFTFEFGSTSISNAYARANARAISSSILNANSPSSGGDNDDNMDNSHDNEDEFVTKEMFLRDMLTHPEDINDDDDDNNNDENENSTEDLMSATVRRKKKNKRSKDAGYRVLDNRDNLPFLVKVTTPDPYTNNEVMRKNARKNTKQEQLKNDLSNSNSSNSSNSKSSNSNSNSNSSNSKSSSKKKKDKKNTRRNLVGMDGVDSINSSIYTRHKDGTLQKVLGEFALEKSTNCGDIIEVVDGTQYQVQRARCQYKYAGGQKFVMTRKILEVKELKRVFVENEMKKILKRSVMSMGMIVTMAMIVLVHPC